jgi:hypothetical protein
VGDTERWLAWKERRSVGGRQRLLVPWSDPTQHEEPFDLLFETEAEAHAARDDAGAEAEPWVLVQVTFQVVKPSTDADNSLDWLRQTARTTRAELEKIRDAATGELDDEGFEQVMRMHGIELLEAAEAAADRTCRGQTDTDRPLPAGDGVPVAATPIALQAGQVVEVPGHGHRRLSRHGDLEPADPHAAAAAVTPIGSVFDLLHVGYMLVQADEADPDSDPQHPSLTLLVEHY